MSYKRRHQFVSIFVTVVVSVDDVLCKMLEPIYLAFSEALQQQMVSITHTHTLALTLTACVCQSVNVLEIVQQKTRNDDTKTPNAN